MDESAAARLEQLVTETTWLRKLALSLVRDPVAADDVLQDTLLVAAEQPPPDDRPLRPWLARVATNIARMRGRSAARRIAREARSHEDTEQAGAHDVLERVETQRLLTELVLSLDAPYRDVILLHYFEGLTSAEIARRQGLSDGTVRWRLKRALDELRAKLDARTDNRAAWLMPIGALARGPIAGGVVVVKKLLAAAIVLLILTMLVVSIRWWRGSRVGEQGEGIARPGTTSVLAARVPGWVVQPDVSARRIAGHVHFLGEPVAGAHVALRIVAQPDVAVADVVTALDGSFALGAPPPAEYVVIASAPGRTPAIVEIDPRDPHARPEQLALELGGCEARAVGRITDAEGTPLVARVGLTGTSGTDGHYELCRPIKTTSVMFAASGFGSVTTLFEGNGEIHRDIVLAPEGVILGRVVHAGEAVANANVIVTSTAGTQGRPRSVRIEDAEIMPSSTTTADDGHFQVNGLAPGRYQVVATATGLGSARVETFVVGASTRELVIAVEDRARVSGKVMIGGRPLAGVEVTSLGPPDLADAAPAFSQEDGSFTIDGAPHGELQWKVRGYRVKTPQVTAVKVARLDGVILEVERGATIRGLVTCDGKGVAGATVEYFHNEWGHGFMRTNKFTVTDASGAYVLADVVPGPSRIFAHTEQASIDEAWVEVLTDRDTVRDMALDHAANASGIVVDANGAPVPNVDVDFELDPAVVSSWHERTRMTDTAGRFSVAPLSAGNYTVYVAPHDGVAYETYQLVHPVKVELVSDHARATELRIEIVIDQLEISGTVVDDQGVALPDTRVRLENSLESDYVTVTAMLPPSMQQNPALIAATPNTVTDSRGAFRFRGLQPFKYSVRAYGADGGQVTAGPIEAGTANVTLTLPRSGSIEGTLVGFGPAPAVNASNSVDVARVATVDGTHFEVIGLHAGTYSITAQDDHGADAQTVEVRAHTATSVTLEAHGRGHIEVHDTMFGAGTPLADVRCIASPRTSELGPWWNNDSLVVTDATGHASLPAAAGAMRLNCLGRGEYSRVQRDVVVPADGSVDVDVESVPVTPGGSAQPGFTMRDDQLPPTVNALRSDPALHSGLTVGDQIISIDGTSTLPFGNGGLAQLLANHAPRTTAILGVLRAGKPLTIALLLD